MQQSPTIAFVLAGVLAFPVLTSAQTTLLSAKHKSVRHHRVPHATGQIACTVAGCQRIPPQCHPETEYNWNGIPTGFDMVVCGPRRR